MPEQTIRGPILNPQADGSVDFLRDGVIRADSMGTILSIESATNSPTKSSLSPPSANLILPPLLDNHIHIPQHPIRGRFMEGVAANPPSGRLLAGLNRNVFPTEAKCDDREYTERIVQQFLADTLAKGVVGGAAYMTVHANACAIALELLPSTWHVGLVLMNQQCPEYLRTDEANLDRDIRALAEKFGQRFIVTDRFAISTNSPLRQRAAKLARELGLRMQTHLNEQIGEKNRVERDLYPDIGNYTDVYRRDGLLERRPILAHCIHMRNAEFDLLGGTGAVVAHCPTSNTLLGSGVMNLDAVISRGIDYAICTDVGASPTTSMLCEMSQYLKVHAGRSTRATPSEALFRSTLAPSRMLGLPDLGTFAPGKPLSFIEVACEPSSLEGASADDVILHGLLELSAKELNNAHRRAATDSLQAHGLDLGPELELLTKDVAQTQRRLDDKVLRVVLNGKTVWQKS